MSKCTWDDFETQVEKEEWKNRRIVAGLFGLIALIMLVSSIETLQNTATSEVSQRVHIEQQQSQVVVVEQAVPTPTPQPMPTPRPEPQAGDTVYPKVFDPILFN